MSAGPEASGSVIRRRGALPSGNNTTVALITALDYRLLCIAPKISNRYEKTAPGGIKVRAPRNMLMLRAAYNAEAGMSAPAVCDLVTIPPMLSRLTKIM
jgi:hypothetical protein